jgi:hypothetical protein
MVYPMLLIGFGRALGENGVPPMPLERRYHNENNLF